MTASNHRMHVSPAPGVSPIDPLTRRPLPPEGRVVRLDTYWRARLAEGSVVLTDPAPAPAAKAPKTKSPDAQES